MATRKKVSKRKGLSESESLESKQVLRERRRDAVRKLAELTGRPISGKIQDLVDIVCQDTGNKGGVSGVLGGSGHLGLKKIEDWYRHIAKKYGPQIANQIPFDIFGNPSKGQSKVKALNARDAKAPEIVKAPSRTTPSPTVVTLGSNEINIGLPLGSTVEIVTANGVTTVTISAKSQ